ncbi:MAG: PilZ domain-containing protein [Myxococcota bacterium]|nr:PilZ domain-containing protein [Myxococcota bacterium]
MSALEVQIPLFERTNREATRREPRQALVRRVEYCRFPRVCADQRMRVAFTLDVSPSGLCIHGGEAEPVGALLRLCVQGLDGVREPEQLARVAWSAADAEDSHRMGLELLESGPSRPLRIRYLRRS